jgi:hypothetical protein
MYHDRYLALLRLFFFSSGSLEDAHIRPTEEARFVELPIAPPVHHRHPLEINGNAIFFILFIAREKFIESVILSVCEQSHKLGRRVD